MCRTEGREVSVFLWAPCLIVIEKKEQQSGALVLILIYEMGQYLVYFLPNWGIKMAPHWINTFALWRS